MADLTNDIIQKIYEIYKQKGYVSENSVFDFVIDAGIPLDETDRVIDRLLSMGVLIQDEPVPVQAAIDSNEKNDVDRTQLDYEEIYSRVLEIDPSLDYIIDYMRMVPAPRTHEMANLMVQAKSGNGYARTRVIELMMKIAIKMALNFTERYHTDLSDTIQYAFEGLIIGYEKFEIGRQDNFTTYAPWWIRQNVDRTIDICSGVHTPVHIDEQLKQVSDIKDSHYCNSCLKNDLCPNLIHEICEKTKMQEERAERLLFLLLPYVSLEEMVEAGSEPADVDAYEEIIEVINTAGLKESVKCVLDTLTEKEAKVIKMRFGFYDGVERTLEEIGKEFGVTRERIRQIEAKAIRRLRHPSRSKQLLGIGNPLLKKVEEKTTEVNSNGKNVRAGTCAEKMINELEDNIQRSEQQKYVTSESSGVSEDKMIVDDVASNESKTFSVEEINVDTSFADNPDDGVKEMNKKNEVITNSDSSEFDVQDAEYSLFHVTKFQQTQLGIMESVAEIGELKIETIDSPSKTDIEQIVDEPSFDKDKLSYEEIQKENQEITIEYLIQLLKIDNGLSRIVEEILPKMMIRDRESIKMRLGLCDYPICSIETIAQRFNISEEKVISVDKRFLQHIKKYLDNIGFKKEIEEEYNVGVEPIDCSNKSEPEDEYEYSEEKEKALEVLANDCDIDAMLELADLYYFNDFDEKALYWYEMAAEFESADAMYSAGIMYRDGQGTEQNYEKALEWFLKAAEQNHPGAINEVGVYYHNQKNMKGKHSEAIKWYKRAAELGELHAQCNLGWYYEYGLGCEPDIYLAKKYYELSAEQGFEDAIRYLKRINKKF